MELGLHIVLKVILQQLLSDTIFIWKTYVLRYGFQVRNTCGTCT
jgi:hypothetical protein